MTERVDPDYEALRASSPGAFSLQASCHEVQQDAHYASTSVNLPEGTKPAIAGVCDKGRLSTAPALRIVAAKTMIVEGIRQHENPCSVARAAFLVSIELRNKREREVTWEKLRILAERYAATRHRQGGDEQVRNLTLDSLKKLINQLTEEIERFEAHMKNPAGA